MHQHFEQAWQAFLAPVLSDCAGHEMGSTDGSVVIYLIGRAAKTPVSEIRTLRDIDLLVVGEGFKHPCQREIVSRGGMTYDITYVSLEALEKQIERGLGTWIDMLAHGKAILMPPGKQEVLIKRCKTLWEQGPGRPEKSALRRIRFEVGQMLEELERVKDDHDTFSFMLACNLQRAVALYFELEGRWAPKVKKQIATLRQIDSGFYSKVTACLSAETNLNQLTNFSQMAAHMLAPYGGVAYEFEKDIYPIDQ